MNGAKQFKRGDTSPEKPGLVFSCYVKRGTHEWWVTTEYLTELRSIAKVKASARRRTPAGITYHREFKKRWSQRPHVRKKKAEWGASEKGKASHKRYREKNQARVKANKRNWGRSAKGKQTARNYRNNMTPEQKALVKARVKAWKKTPYGRLCENLRRRISLAFTRKGYTKRSRTHELLGCDFLTFQLHLQAQFKRGMSWNNYGIFWHVDHVKPLCNFDLRDVAQQRIAFHFTNCQPLWSDENMQKNRY